MNEPQDTSISQNYVVNRPIYDATTFDKTYKTKEIDNLKEFKENLKKGFSDSCSSRGFLNLLLSNLPIIVTIKNYKKSYIFWDIIAGLTMCIFHIPQGLAYGLLAGLLPVNGLYTSLFPVMIYLVLASSNHLSLGTFALMSLLVREPVERLSAEYIPNNSSGFNSSQTSISNLDAIQEYRLLIAISVTFLAGLIQFLLGILHLGFIVNYLSDAMISGFTTGAAFQVATSQFPSILGYSVGKYSGIKKLFLTYYDLFRKLGETNLATLIVSLVCMFILIIFKEFINPLVKQKIRLPIPTELLVLVMGTLVSFLASFNSRFGIEIVGIIPSGLPSPVLPDPSLFALVVSDAISLAIVGFAIAAALAKMFASKFNQIVDFNQELKAHGLANIFVSFFQGFFAGAALARTSTVVEVGMKTQLASVVSCVLMLLVLLVIGPLFETVPRCLLSAIILVALKGLFKQVFDLKKLWKISIYDFLTWIVAFVATIILDVPLGLVSGFVFSVFTVLIRSQIPKHGLLGYLPTTDIYRSPGSYSKATEISNVKIFRFEAPLYFANCEQFRILLFKSTGLDGNNDSVNNQTSKTLLVTEPTVTVVEVDGVMTTAFNRLNHLATTNENRENQIHLEESTALNEKSPESTISPEHNNQCSPSHIIIDFSSIPYIDCTGIKVVKEILQSLKLKKIDTILAGCNEDIRSLFLETDVHKVYSKEIMFLTVHDAVLYINSLP